MFSNRLAFFGAPGTQRVENGRRRKGRRQRLERQRRLWVETLEDRRLLTDVAPLLPDLPGVGSIQGQKFEDLNANRVQDPGELGMNRWQIEVFQNGQLVSSTHTAPWDRDGDGTIDPQTEDGWYRFQDLQYGDYEVKEVDQAGWRQTFPNTVHTVTVGPAPGYTYTTNDDFDLGTLVGVEHDTVPDQLQLSAELVTLPFIWVPNEDSTVSKIDTVTGDELGRYRVAPPSISYSSPSRTTVDQDGSCWVGNRDAGTVVKIGLVEAGNWVDRNGNGVADTSQDLNGDGNVTGSEILPWGEDEAVLLEVVLVQGHEGPHVPGTYGGPYDPNHWGTSPRGLAIDADNNLWAGTWSTQKYYYIDGETGSIGNVVDVSQWGHSAYGAVIDRYGALWSSGAGAGHVLWMDLNHSPPIGTVPLGHFAYGLGLDDNHLYVAGWENGKISRIDLMTGVKEWTKNAPWQLRGIAVTSDGDVWAASTGHDTLYRFDHDVTAQKAAIPVGNGPTGVAVDADGKVWTCNLGDQDVKRIDPATNAVDLSKTVVGSGGHYSYSDMTGIIARSVTTQVGTWTVEYDAGVDRVQWGAVSWTADEPADSSITVKVSSRTEGGSFGPAVTVQNGVPPTGLADGRYLRVTATLRAGSEDESPILYDLSVSGEPVHDFGNFEMPVVYGRKFEDLDNDGLQDPGEPGLDGWTIEVFDPLGPQPMVVSGVTHSVDIDGDNRIDPATESGWYEISLPRLGEFRVREQLQPGWTQSSQPVEPVIRVEFPGQTIGARPEDSLPQCGPGEHWLQTCRAGQEHFFAVAQVAIDVDLDDIADYTIPVAGHSLVQRGDPYGSTGTHPDTVDTEMVAMDLIGLDPLAGAFRVRAGDGIGNLENDGPLHSPGQLREQLGDPWLVDSFFDVFFDVTFPIASGLGDLHNTAPLRLEAVIESVPLYLAQYASTNTAPVPLVDGQGQEQARLVSVQYQPVFGPSFGNVRSGSIHGYKFRDGNANGVWDEGEPGLGGVEIQLRDKASLEGYVQSWDEGGENWQYWVADPTAPPPGGSNSPVRWSSTGGFADSGYISTPLDELYATWGGYWPAYMAPPDPVDPVDLTGQTLRVRVNDFGSSGLPDTALRLFVGEWLSPTDYVFFAHSTPIAIGDDWSEQASFDIGGDDDWIELVRVGSTKTPSDLYVDPQQWGFALVGLGVEPSPFYPLHGTLAFDELQIVTELLETTTTDVDGQYFFDDLAPGRTYWLTEVPPEGYEQTTPDPPPVFVESGFEYVATEGQALALIEQGHPADRIEILPELVFGNVCVASVHGQKFEDLDADGRRDPGEPGLNGWTIELYDAVGTLVRSALTGDMDLNGDGLIDPVTERGWYWFDNVPCGDYTIREVLPVGWVQTVPAGGEYHVTVGPDPVFTYTVDADFDQGILFQLNHDPPNNNQLQLDDPILVSFPFINVAASDRGTMVRINTDTGQIVGEYWTAPAGMQFNPSRTTVDLDGNVWVTNRNEAGTIGGVLHGSVTKIGLVIGGTRGDKNPDGSFTPNPLGEYLQGPFAYSTCSDRDGDGLIHTSRGLVNILAWPDVTDGVGGTDNPANDARVEDACDECIVVYQRLPDAENARHVSVDSSNNVWVGGYPYAQRSFHNLDGTTGAILNSFDARAYGAGGYGGLIDGNGVIWSSGITQNTLLRYDTATSSGMAINVTQSYGLGIDGFGNIWNARYLSSGQVSKISPSGAILGTYSTGASYPRGVAVTPDNHVWVANSGAGSGSTVAHLDNSGNLIKLISVGYMPTGVAVDSHGKVWVSNYNSDNVMRIDPALDSGKGAVDLTVGLGAGARPYNYSDMTGNVVVSSTSPQGTWTVIRDAGGPFHWTGAEWNTEPEGAEPPGSNITIQVRAADSQAALGAKSFITVSKGVDFSALGRYLEIKATLRPATVGGVNISPVLSDLSVTGHPTYDFGNAAHGSIHGFKFEDLDGDGVFDPEDLPWPGVEIRLHGDVDGDGVPDVVTTTTDADGEYGFVHLFPGPYAVTETPPPGSEPSISDRVEVFVHSREELVADLDMEIPLRPWQVKVEAPELAFGNSFHLDYGDAPDPRYPTLRANDGARHLLGGPLWLGGNVDRDLDGQPTAAADGDDVWDLNDDEDGVRFLTPLVRGRMARVEVVATVAGKLNAWMDFNLDGDWSDRGEHIFVDQSLLPGPNYLAFPVPRGSQAGSTYARFRVDKAGGLSYDGLARDGEVEDYRVELVFAPIERFDFNAPGSPTQAAVPPNPPSGEPDYTGVLPTDAASLGRGYGWVTSPYALDRGALPSPDYADLLRDGAWQYAPRDFGMHLDPGTYEVTVVLGDANYARDRMNVTLVDGTSPDLSPVTDVATAAGQLGHRTFTATTAPDGRLTLRFSDGGGDPYWVVASVEARRPVTPFQVTIDGPLGSRPADGGTDTFHVTGATLGAVYTLSTTLGSIEEPDADAKFAGVQVLAPGADFSFVLRRGTTGGTATVSVEEVCGASRGSTTQVYAFPELRRFDFDGPGVDTQTESEGDFTSVRGAELFNATKGYGWTTASTLELERSAAGISQPQLAALYRDGHWNYAVRTFQVAADPALLYDVRVHTGDRNYARDRLQVTVEGAVQPEVATAANEFKTITVYDVACGADGILDIRFADLGGDPYWVINGVEIAVSQNSTPPGPGLPDLPDLPGPEPTDIRHFDFGTSSSPEATGYTRVGGSNAYSPAVRYGWQTNAYTLNRSPADPLLRDGHWGTDNTFLVNLPDGDYTVHVTLGDANYARNYIDVQLEGVLLPSLTGLSSAAGQFVHASGQVTITDGQLNMRVRSTAGDPYFVINALDLWDASEVALHSLSVGGGSSSVPVSGSNANAGAMITVGASLGTIPVAQDLDPLRAGVQVQANASGDFTFTFEPPGGGGAVTLTTLETDGHGQGSVSQPYSVPAMRQFDFNASTNVTAAGYTAVRAAQLFDPGNGYGWVSSPYELDRGTASSSPVALYRDGHWQYSTRTFLVTAEANPAVTYQVTVHTGDQNYPRDQLQISIESGNWTALSPPTAAGQFRTVVINGVWDVNSDGKLDISFSDLGGDPYWVVNGVEVLQTGAPMFRATSFPGDLSLLGSLHSDGMTVPDGENAESVSTRGLLRPAMVDRVLTGGVEDELWYYRQQTRANDDIIERLVASQQGEPEDLDALSVDWIDALAAEKWLD